MSKYKVVLTSLFDKTESDLWSGLTRAAAFEQAEHVAKTSANWVDGTVIVDANSYTVAKDDMLLTQFTVIKDETCL